jgi:hypothetical protein
MMFFKTRFHADKALSFLAVALCFFKKSSFIFFFDNKKRQARKPPPIALIVSIRVMVCAGPIMLTAGAVMMFTVMVARYFRIVNELLPQKILHRLIRIAGNTAVQCNARLRKCTLCACTYTSANKRIDLALF